LESFGILVLAKKLSKGVHKFLLLKLKVKLKLKQISSNGHGSTAKRLVCTTIILMLSIVYYAAIYLSMHLHCWLVLLFTISQLAMLALTIVIRTYRR
jgi:hypothetical protein